MILSDKADWGHNYCVHYEKWFESLRNEVFTFMELGIENGDSLRGWRDYFSVTEIIGVDNVESKLVFENRIYSYCCDQSDEKGLSRICLVDNPLVIVDDASHISSLTIKTFEILFPLLKSGGLYCIEDLSCSYRNGFEGSQNLTSLKEPTIMNYLFEMVHSINNPQYGIAGYTQPDKWKDIEGVHFYPELVIIKKK